MLLLNVLVSGPWRRPLFASAAHPKMRCIRKARATQAEARPGGRRNIVARCRGATRARLAANRMFRRVRLSEWCRGCDAAAVSDMLTLRRSQVERKRRPALLATCMDDLVQATAEDGLSGHRGRPGGQRAARTESPKILPFAPRGRILSPLIAISKG